MAGTAPEVSKLVSRLRFKVKDRRRMSNEKGPEGRLQMMRKTVTALIKHERIELHYHRGDEARGYAERLISDAIRYGDCHKETMDMAKYWLLEEQLIHKLFKVLAPRYQNLPVSYTKLWKAPYPYNIPSIKSKEKCVLELRNNIYPPLERDKLNNKNLIHNVLLDEAKREYRNQKYAALAEKLAPIELEGPKNTNAVVQDSVVKTETVKVEQKPGQ